MCSVNSAAAVCHRSPVTRWSCFHCPVYRCYETALGAVDQTETEAAPSRFYGAPTSFCQSAVEEQTVSAKVDQRSQQEQLPSPLPFLPSGKAPQEQPSHMEDFTTYFTTITSE